MTPRPESKHELARALVSAHTAGRPTERVDLGGLQRVLQYAPEDMTVRVEAGLTLGALQRAVGEHGQWLPIDPPDPERLTIAELIAANASGPRRLGYGTIREHLIGLQVVLADGRLVQSGGNVVKNVAGFDLLKVFIGARDSLGIPVEASFKLLPRPVAEEFLQSPLVPLERAKQLTEAVLTSPLTPVVLDWHRGVLPGAGVELITVVLGLAGTQEDVAWGIRLAREIGFPEPSGLEYERAFWSGDSARIGKLSVLPSRVLQAVGDLGSIPFVARAGTGVIYALAWLLHPCRRESRL